MIFKKETKEQTLERIVKTLLFNLNTNDLNHTEQVIVLKMVSDKLQEERESVLNDIVNANGI